eukprot:5602815-Prymnesium_polylepis.1
MRWSSRAMHSVTPTCCPGSAAACSQSVLGRVSPIAHVVLNTRPNPCDRHCCCCARRLAVALDEHRHHRGAHTALQPSPRAHARLASTIADARVCAAAAD